MRNSCNGCRVLRKGCSEDCILKPCLEWINDSESQANATLFLAKFYGRAGLFNLINAGPHHSRPEIFKSLLYEACGRIVNPVHGSAGLLCSGNWHLCHAAVEAVFSGEPIVQLSADSAAGTMSPPLKAGDIRHVAKDESSAASAPRGLRKVKTRGKFKRAGAKPTPKSDLREGSPDVTEAAMVMWSWSHSEEVMRSPSRESGVSQHAQLLSFGVESVGEECASGATVEESLAKPRKPDGGSNAQLELTLSLSSCNISM